MQGLTAAPRGHLTADQVTGILTGSGVTVSAGLELLDSTNVVVEDISDDLLGGVIDHANYASVHGSCSIRISRELAWGRDRVRPYMVLADDTTEARFNLGVYVLTTPSSQRSEEPVTYEATGYDLLHLLQDSPGDTYVVTAGTTYVQAVRNVLTASGIGAPVMLDGTLQDTTLPSDMVWALIDSAPDSWLRIINDLLSAINYRGLWADQDGALRSGPYQDPAVRPVEWVFDTSDTTTNLVAEDRSLAQDVWKAPNWWRFVRKSMATQPIEGAGLYTVANQSEGATSIDSLGRTVRKVTFLDAANQTSLEAQGDRIVSQDKAVSRTFELQVDPLPIAGHFDVVTLIDAGSSDKCQVSSWSLPLDGSPGRWSLEAVNG